MTIIRKTTILLLILLMVPALFAQQRHALVIGNSNYTGSWGPLTNPINDANDMAAALRNLDFQVEVLTDATLDQMDAAISRYRRRLNAARNTYGFFFYAGHGTQFEGENYLIPVNANTPRLSMVPDQSLSVDFVLQSLESSRNDLNMIVLDACRDVPNTIQQDTRGGSSRGLSSVSRAPPGSIIMYATGANTAAADGTGRNGLFTGYLLTNLATPGLTVNEIFTRTGGEVARATSGRQYPEIRQMFHEPVVLKEGPASAPLLTAQDHYERGMAFIGNSDYESAFLEANEAIRLNPNYSDAYVLRAVIYSDFGRNPNAAMADYAQAISLNPNNAKAYYNRGFMYLRYSLYDLAIEDYTQVIRIDPNFAEGYSSRGRIYDWHKKDYDRAIADYTQAIRLDPNSAGAYNDRGLAYAQGKGDSARAIADFTQAIRLNPNSAGGYSLRGGIYYDIKDYDRAIADYTQAIRLDPDGADYYYRGLAYQQKGDSTRANADFARARELGFIPPR